MARCPRCGGALPEAPPASFCPHCGMSFVPGPPPIAMIPVRPIRVRGTRRGEILQKTAGGLSVAAGVMLIIALPLSLWVVERYLGIGLLYYSTGGLFVVCSLGVHVLLAVGAFWGGYRGLRFELATGSMLIAVGVGAVLAAIFLLGTIFGLIAGGLLIAAGALTFAS